MSATAVPFEVTADRVIATAPAWNVPIRAKMPTFSITSAKSSSMRPKPFSSARRARTSPLSAGRLAPSRGSLPLPIRSVMAAFAYSAINAQGSELSGEISASDLSAAREQLRVKGLLAQSIKELDGGGAVGQTNIS